MVQEWRELLTRRNRTSKTRRLYEDDQPTNKYSWDGMVGTSLHYEEVEDSGQWLEVDPRIVPSDEPGWDWEMQKSHWRLLIHNGGWIAFERGGVAFGFRLEGWTYLNWATKEHDVIRDAIYGTPIVEGNQLTWQNIFGSVGLEVVAGSDGLGLRIVIPQSVRDAMPPTPYPPADTFFVFYYEVDWTNVPYTADVAQHVWWKRRMDAIEPVEGLWLASVDGKVKSWLRLGWAMSVIGAEEEPIELKHRYVRKAEGHYLLNGASWDLLKSLPAGDIELSFNVDNGFFAPEGA